MAANVCKECLRPRVLESSLSSQKSCCDEALQENIFDEAFFKKISKLENLPINNQNLQLVKEFIFW